MGLGRLGGGVATAKWFARHGARVTVTDLRARRELTSSLRALGRTARHMRLVLGRHDLRDFRTHDIVAVNPAVRRESPYLAAAKRAGSELVNDAKIFFDLVPNPIVAVTGTRGKTTTTNWIAHLLRGRYPRVRAAGNTPEMPLLSLIDTLRTHRDPAVVELSSWQLERIGRARRGPDVALITNLYRDHLNRYPRMESYARAKANLFRRQSAAQAVILNAENPWTRFFLRQRPRSRVYFFSLKPLPKNRDGIYVSRGCIRFKEEKKSAEVLGRRATRALAPLGRHNLQNLLGAMLAAHLMGATWRETRARLRNLPAVPFREEIVVARKNLTVVNDTTATSPDGTIAALDRFRDRDLILIAGGTDKELEFAGWARAVKRRVRPERLFLLEGSATEKMVRALSAARYFKGSYPQLFATFPEIIKAVKRKVRQSGAPVVLFSPGAASFEKFKNEFDRGRKFNLYWR